MELFLSIQKVLWIAAVLAEAAVVVRLFRERLLREYPFFAVFLAADAIANVALMQFDIESRS